jgi:hypothetical protein
MDNEQAERLILALERIADALDRQSFDPTRPRFTKPISEFSGFNWDSIGASIIKSDRYGAAVVERDGQYYYRRSKSDFGEDVWFSHSVGKDEAGKSRYLTLIKFTAPRKVKSLPEELLEAI